MPNNTIHIKSHRDISANGGKQVTVFGKYIAVDVRKLRTSPAVYVGHAAIQLADGTLIYLEPPHLKHAIRPKSEMDLYKNVDVVAQGLLFPEAPSPSNGAAYMKVPCLMFSFVMFENRYVETTGDGQKLPINDETNSKEVKKSADFTLNDRKMVHVFGKYIEVDVRMKKDNPPVYAGHVAIQLEDGTLVYLFPSYDKKAIRPAAEINEYKNKEVVVFGRFMKKCSPPKSNIPYEKVSCLEVGVVIKTPKKYHLMKADEQGLEIE